MAGITPRQNVGKRQIAQAARRHNAMKKNPSDDFKLAGQMETLRSDERGSLTLLAGMMVFLVTIFAIFAFDTNKAIYDRIVAQNAVDAAADSAALWQARFCNVEQQLNNLHYTVDEAMCIAEGVSAVMCAVAIPLEVIKDIPFCEWAYGAWVAACVLCDFLPPEDEAQHVFYDALVGKSYSVQEDLAIAAPFLAFANADACAYGSGANNIFDAAIQTVEEYVTDGVSLIPGTDASSMTSTFQSINGVIGSTLGQIPIYAFPLNPIKPCNCLMSNPTNNNDLPEYWLGFTGRVKFPSRAISPARWDAAERRLCSEVEDASHNNSEGDDRQNDDNFHPQWGWADQYEYGNPGYLTWIAGVTNAPEILGLGNLKWLNDEQNICALCLDLHGVRQRPTAPEASLSPSRPTLPLPAAFAGRRHYGGSKWGCKCRACASSRFVIRPEMSTNFTRGSSIPFPFTIYH